MINRRLLAGIAFVSIAMGILGGCANGADSHPSSTAGTKIHMGSVHKRYVDASGLGRDSTAIVRGTLGPVIDRRIDDGGLGNPASGIPMAFYSFSIQARSAQAKDLPATIRVGWIDTDKVDAEDASPLHPGQDYVLFLERITPEVAPGVAGVGIFYVPVGGNAGVFEVEGSKAVATDPELERVTAGSAIGPRVGGRLTADPSQLLSLPTENRK